MIKQVNRALNIVMGSVLGVFMGHGIYVYWDYKTHPDLYAMQSAPWYTSILMYGLVMGIALMVGLVIKLVLRIKIQNMQI